ncbi:hypothetical protein L2E82_04175 [Cichorium intybus]|uniref:Uncharacterized protein n=1 Tax=Cichorium intybus TaxID=13427 RepID=A0ACB9H641_CICIN|nr:hypothetical protein L2E82_04175 [Cichorium intybus]
MMAEKGATPCDRRRKRSSSPALHPGDCFSDSISGAAYAPSDCSSADLASTPSDYISGDCIFHSFFDFFLHQHHSLLGFDSQNGIPRRLFGKGGFDAGFKPCALAYNVLIQFWGGNGFQKFEKIKDPSRPSRQLEELTGKMKECKSCLRGLNARNSNAIWLRAIWIFGSDHISFGLCKACFVTTDPRTPWLRDDRDDIVDNGESSGDLAGEEGCRLRSRSTTLPEKPGQMNTNTDTAGNRHR